jgi:hypothetical protein
MRKPVVAFLVVGLFCFADRAKADVVESVNMTFQSGATFSGSVSFTNDFSSITDVSGTLTGYQYPTVGYVGTGSDVIDSVFALNTNYSSGPPIYGNFLQDGPSDGSAPFNFILFTYDYTNAPTLVLADPSAGYLGLGNSVNGLDPFVSGSIGAVPELSTWIMLLIGFVGLGMNRRTRKLRFATRSSTSAFGRVSALLRTTTWSRSARTAVSLTR